MWPRILTRKSNESDMSADERAVSDVVHQTVLADEMLLGSHFYPFPDRVIKPDTQHIARLIDKRTGRVLMKKAGQPDILLSAVEAFDRTWADDEVAQRFLRGHRIFMTGAMRRSDGKWFVDTADADDHELQILRRRLAGFGAVVNANTLSLGGAWGYLFVRLLVVVDAGRDYGRIVDARVQQHVDVCKAHDIGSPVSPFREIF